MLCEICQRPAAGQCSGCGALFCADHGGERCFRCSGALVAIQSDVIEESTETGFYTTDRDSRYTGKGYLQCYTKPGMPTIYLDDPEPPGCHLCHRLAKNICFNCHQLFCFRHRGGQGICQSCGQSANLALWVLLGMFALIGLLLLMNH